MKAFLHSQHCVEYFIGVVSFNPHNNLMHLCSGREAEVQVANTSMHTFMHAHMNMCASAMLFPGRDHSSWEFAKNFVMVPTLRQLSWFFNPSTNPNP